MTLVSQALLACSGLLIASGCGGAPQAVPSDYLFSGLGAVKLVQTDDTTAIGSPLRVVKVITGFDGTEFGRLGEGAGYGNRLVIADETRCELVQIVDTVATKRMGGCGDGPGELRNIGGVAANADSSFVLNLQSRRWQSFGIDGSPGPSKAIVFPSAVRDIQGLVNVAAGSVTLSLAVRSRGPVPTSEPVNSRLVVRISTADSSAMQWSPLVAPKIETDSKLAGSTGYPSCGSGSHIVVLNRWAFESVVLDAVSLSPIVHTLSRAPWPLARTLPSGVVRQSPSYFGVACGASAYVIAQFLPDTTIKKRPPPVERGMIEIRRYDGTVEYRRVLGRGDSLLLGTPFGLSGGILAIRNNVMVDAPAVVLVRIQ